MFKLQYIDQLDIDNYFYLIDTALDKFNFLNDISEEGFFSDAWEAIKRAVSWLIEKIGDFIRFIVDLIKRVFNFIVGLFSSDTGSNKGDYLPPKSKRPPKDIKVEANKNEVNEQIQHVSLLVGAEGIVPFVHDSEYDTPTYTRTRRSTANSRSSKSTEKKTKKLPGCVNVNINPHALLQALNDDSIIKKAQGKLTIGIELDHRGNIRYTDVKGIKILLEQQVECASKVSQVLKDTDGPYQMSYNEARNCIHKLQFLVTNIKALFQMYESKAEHIREFLKTLQTELEKTHVDGPNKSRGYDTRDRITRGVDIDNLLDKFKNFITFIGGTFEFTQSTDMMMFSEMGETSASINILKGMITISRQIMQYFTTSSKAIAQMIKGVALCEKEISQDLVRKHAASLNDIYFNKVYDVPSDIKQALHMLFDYIDCRISVGDLLQSNHAYQCMKLFNLRHNKTKYDLKNVVLSSSKDKVMYEHKMTNFLATSQSIRMEISMFSGNRLKTLMSSLVNASVDVNKPRELMKSLANMTTLPQLAFAFLHEARHVYDYSNDIGEDAKDRIMGEDYDDYGASRIEANADYSAATIERYFKPHFNKITSWLSRLLVQMRKDVRAELEKNGIKE